MKRTLRDRIAEAIRGESTFDEQPWDQLKADRKIGWLGDADRALAVLADELERWDCEMPVSEVIKRLHAALEAAR
jgi:hypothetical protein